MPDFNLPANNLGSAIILSLIDKGALAFILLVAGLYVNRKLERFKTEMNRESELLKLRANAQIQFLERQLSDFFWPVLLKFEKDSSLWRRIPGLSADKNILPKNIEDKIEMNYLLPNHLETVKIIESKIHLVQDAELISMLEHYSRHVAIYSALRASNLEFNPIDIGEPYPEGLPKHLREKTLELQRKYNELVGQIKHS